MKEWAIGIVLALILVGVTVGYIRYDAVQDERAKKELEAAQAYQTLNEQYNKLSEDYLKLKAAKEARRQANVVKEDKIINENREYYAGDCFDSIGLQHIQEAQSASPAK